MSTYYGYVCKSHTPNLPSEHWFNHGDQLLADTYRIERAGNWPNDAFGDPIGVGGNYGHSAPIWWLRQHPNCAIAILDEYGRETPLDPTAPAPTSYALEVDAEGYPHAIGPFPTREAAEAWMAGRKLTGSWNAYPLAAPQLNPPEL